MELKHIEPVIAARQLSLVSGGSVVVRIGAPRPFPEGDNSYCPFEILGLSPEVKSWAGGVDDIQSLQLALDKIGIILASRNRDAEDRLYWLTEGDPDLGFPMPPE